MRSLRNAGDLLPQLLGFVVLAEDGDVQLVLRQAVVFGQQVPGKVDRFGFEVIAEGEVAEHLEERVVAARVADVLEIVVLAAGANAFLRRCGARVVALLLSKKDVLELVHAGVGEQQRRIVGGTSEELRTGRCARSAKKSRNFWRISWPVMGNN